MLDPGIGFAKTFEHNLTLLNRLGEFASLADRAPVLVGASRKAFIGKICEQPEPLQRDWGTSAACCAAIVGGARSSPSAQHTGDAPGSRRHGCDTARWIVRKSNDPPPSRFRSRARARTRAIGCLSSRVAVRARTTCARWRTARALRGQKKSRHISDARYSASTALEFKDRSFFSCLSRTPTAFSKPGSSEIQRGHTLAAESVERGARADDSSEHPARPAEHCTHKWRQAAVLTRTAQEFGGRGERRSDAVDIAVPDHFA